MVAFVGRRLLASVGVLLGLSLVSFFLMHLIPGGPVVAMLGQRATPSEVLAFRHAYGLDRPLPLQYLLWLRDLATGHLGVSYVTGMPVSALIGQALPHTLELMGPALFLAVGIAVPLGMVQAKRSDTAADHILSGAGFLFWSMPTFWLGLLMVMAFAVHWRLFPTGGIASPLRPFAGFPGYVAHSVLPVVTLVLATFARWARYMRSSMLDVLGEDYIRTARAKGLGPWAVLWRHALRNAAMPLITLLGLAMPELLGGALVVEVVFNYPGMGLLFFQSALSLDYPTLLALVMAGGALTVLGNLLADILYAVVDPRISYRYDGSPAIND